MTQPALHPTHPSLKDRNDFAAFFLNLSRTGGDVVAYRCEGRPAFLINRPDHAEHVLSRNQANYKNPYHPYAELSGHYRPAGSFVLHLDQSGSSRLRSTERVAQELVTESVETAQMLQALSVSGPVDIGLETKKMMFRALVRILFEVDAGHLSDDFTRAVSFIEECHANAFFATSGTAFGPLEHHYLTALKVQEQTSIWIAREARIVHAGVDVPERLRTAIVRTLLNGYNATATALCWLIYCVTRAGAVLDRLSREIDDLFEGGEPTVPDFARLHETRRVIMETLRLYPPAWNLGREALAEDLIGGIVIPAGALVSVCPYAMHRHPSLWDRPGDFLPERFAPNREVTRHPFAYIPFGGGSRKCPAGHLVIGHLQIALAVILRLCRIELASSEPVRPRGLVALRPHPGVWARFEPRGRRSPVSAISRSTGRS